MNVFISTPLIEICCDVKNIRFQLLELFLLHYAII
jgi:hypothetical protein